MIRSFSIVVASLACLLVACEKKPVALQVTPEGVSFNRAGMTQTFTASGIDSENHPLPVQVNWSSSNVKVVSVTADGKATAVGSGSATITASHDTLSKNVTAFVEIAAVVKLDQAEVKIAKLSERPKITATVLNEKGLPLLRPSLHFSAENPAIVAIDANGTITGLKRGTTTVVAADGNVKAEAKVVVEAGAEEKAPTAKMDKAKKKK